MRASWRRLNAEDDPHKAARNDWRFHAVLGHLIERPRPMAETDIGPCGIFNLYDPIDTTD